MDIKVIGSGSKGNCYLVSDGMYSLLLDAGVKFLAVQKALNWDTSAIGGCLITHSHGDHCKAAADMAERGIRLYTNLSTKLELPCNAYLVESEKTFGIDTFRIIPFEVKHDASCYGYQIDSNVTGERLLYITDAGGLKHSFRGVTDLMLEINHSLKILNARIKNGEIAYKLAKRISETHMSLELAKKYLTDGHIDTSKLKKVMLLHLSDDNSNADLFLREVQRLVPHAEIVVC